MPDWPYHPIIYEINTWAWLDDLSRQSGRSVTLGTVPQSELRRLAAYGFDGLWLMGVWQRSPAGRTIAQEHPGLQAGYRRALSDYTPDDVVGSPYAVYRYQVDRVLGGDDELAALRQRLRQLSLRLILDFVPNHLAVDHAWLAAYPARFVQGSPADLESAPGNYFRMEKHIFAHGRDPYFPGWTDTVQLDYRQPATRLAMTDLLLSIAQRCDGVRCDMAMLVTHDVFRRTWGGHFDPGGAEFWPEAIASVQKANPGFLMMAEAYWDMEYALQQQGFDHCYDKRLYDRLKGDDPAVVGEHLALADFDYQRHLVRFIENHDESRALATFGPQRSRAAAVVALTLPGARLLHEGQLEGRRLKLPVQLGRRQPEPPEPGLEPFYRRLLAVLQDLVFQEGQWRYLPPREAWPGNPNFRNVVAHLWSMGSQHRLLVANLASDSSQCFVPLDALDLVGRTWLLDDLLGDASYLRDGDELLAHGLYLDMQGHTFHLFRLAPR